MAETSVKIDWTPTVTLDCRLYGLSDYRFKLLQKNLRNDPYLGESTNGIHYEYLFRQLSVAYVITYDRKGIVVYIGGIRPVESVSSWPKVARLTRQTIDLVKTIKDLLRIFGA